MIVNISGKTARLGDLILFPRLGMLSEYEMRGDILYLVDPYTFNQYKDIRPDIAVLNDCNKIVCSDCKVCKKISNKVVKFIDESAETIMV